MKFFIPIAVGAIIGYITNWLAIKMLFRPYHEKRIFGVKIPFTPGLIPKESERIAKNIGESIANYLITPETITRAIESDRIDENIRVSIEFSISKIRNSNNTIRSFLNSFGEENYSKVTDFIETKLLEFILKRIKGERFKEEIKLGINQIIINEIINLENDNRRLGEVLPQVIVMRIKGYIIVNKKNISKALKEIIKNPSVKMKLRKTIENVAEKNIPRIITTFMSLERISEKVYFAIESQLDNVATSDDIVFAINKVIDKMLESPVSDLSSSLAKNISHENISNLSQSIIEHIYGKEDKGPYINMLEEKLSIIIHNVINEFGNKPISNLMENIDEESIENIIRFLKTILQTVAINKLPSIVESLNIAKIVEDQINSFDVSYAENLILDISNKELKAITWLGALLGAILGVLSPLLQNI